MKRFILTVLMIPLMLFSQIEKQGETDTDLSKYKDKEVTLIGYKYYGPNSITCPVKAVKITSQKVFIDTCYKLSEKKFTNDIVQSLDDNPFYIELLKVSKKKILHIQSELENIKDDKCDESSTPYIIMIEDKKGSETYGLRRLSCFAGKSEDFMKNVDVLINSIQ